MTSSSSSSMSFLPHMGTLALLLVASLCLLFPASAAPAASLTTAPYIPADRVIGGWSPLSLSSSHSGSGNVWIRDSNWGVRSISADGSRDASYLFTGSPQGLPRPSCVVPDRSNGNRAWMSLTRGNFNISVVLVDVVTQQVVVEFDTSGRGACPIGSDQQGNVVLAGYRNGTLISVFSQQGSLVSNFSIPQADHMSLTDMDAHGNVWLLRAPNGSSRNLILYGYTLDGVELSTTKPNLDDLPLTSISGISVDSNGIVYFLLLNSAELPSWNAVTSAREQTYTIALASNFIGALLTLYSDNLAMVASPGLGAIELIDLTQPTAPPSSHPIVQSQQGSLYGAAKTALFNGATPAESVLFVEAFGQGASNFVGVNPVTGTLITRCPSPTSVNILNSNIAVDNTGFLYFTTMSKAVQIIDPAKGSVRSFDQTGGGGAIAYDLANNHLFITPSSSTGQVGLYATNGTSLGSISLQQSYNNIREAHVLNTPSGATFFYLLATLGMSSAVYSFDEEGSVVATLSVAPYDALAFDVHAASGYTYVLSWDQVSTSPTFRYCYVAVFDNGGVLTQYLAPPLMWTTAQDMRGVAVDVESNVYATSFVYNAVAVWSASSRQPRSVPMSPKTTLLSPILAMLAEKSTVSHIPHAALTTDGSMSTSATSAAVGTTHSALSAMALTAVVLVLAAVSAVAW